MTVSWPCFCPPRHYAHYITAGERREKTFSWDTKVNFTVQWNLNFIKHRSEWMRLHDTVLVVESPESCIRVRYLSIQVELSRGMYTNSEHNHLLSVLLPNHHFNQDKAKLPWFISFIVLQLLVMSGVWHPCYQCYRR